MNMPFIVNHCPFSLLIKWEIGGDRDESKEFGMKLCNEEIILDWVCFIACLVCLH